MRQRSLMPTPLLVTVVLAACASRTFLPSPEPTATPSVAPRPASTEVSTCTEAGNGSPCRPPVDDSVVPLSLSHPTTEAAAVLERCLAGRPDVAVIAAGRIPHARDAWQYAPVPMSQRNIQSDEPMWILQLRGTFNFPTPSGGPPEAGVWRDPLCVVRFGDSGYIDVSRADASAVTRTLPPPTP